MSEAYQHSSKTIRDAADVAISTCFFLLAAWMAFLRSSTVEPCNDACRPMSTGVQARPTAQNMPLCTHLHLESARDQVTATAKGKLDSHRAESGRAVRHARSAGARTRKWHCGHTDLPGSSPWPRGTFWVRPSALPPGSPTQGASSPPFTARSLRLWCFTSASSWGSAS